MATIHGEARADVRHVGNGHALETIVCCTCGIVFAVPQHWRRMRLNHGDWFWCPNGHHQHYTEAKTAREKLQAANEMITVQDAMDTLSHELGPGMVADRGTNAWLIIDYRIRRGCMLSIAIARPRHRQLYSGATDVLPGKIVLRRILAREFPVILVEEPLTRQGVGLVITAARQVQTREAIIARWARWARDFEWQDRASRGRALNG